MRVLRSMAIVLALCGSIGGCSLIYDGSGYTGGTAPPDGGDSRTDGGGADADGGADVDAGPIPCDHDPSVCGSAGYCDDGFCAPCDADGDGFLGPQCAPPIEALDCDDTNPRIHPGALPICGNGVDESCSTGRMLDASGVPMILELGFHPVREIQGPPDRPSRLRVHAYGGSAARARVFWQIDDPRKTVMSADVVFDGGAIQARTLEDLVDAPLLGGASRVGYDLQYDERLGAGYLVVVHQDGSRRVHVRSVDFYADGTFSDVDAKTIDPEGFGELALAGQPAMLFRDGGWQVGVAGTFLEEAFTKNGLFRIDPGAGRLELVSREVHPDTGTWSHSDGHVAVFPSYDRHVLVWNGVVTGGESDALRVPLPGETTGTPQAHRFRSSSGHGFYTILAPLPGELRFLRGDCQLDLPLSSCLLETVTSYPTALGNMWTALGSAHVSETALTALWADVDSMNPLRLRVLENEGFSAELTSIPIPSPGSGRVHESALHFTASDLSPGFVGTFVYAYVRGDTSWRIHVGAVRVCAGTGV